MKLPILISASVLLLILATYVNSLAVMSVDFGSEWMKVGIVSPGVPMEIALNKESKRKTPTVISFRDSARSFGEDAQTVGIRFPKNAYFYLLELLGKDIHHPLVKLYQQRFPYYEIVEDKERGSILFKHDDETFYSPEELVAQLLYRAKEFAEASARQPIKECVITVPGYFNQVERTALLQAAQLAEIKVLQLINDYTAVALNYAIFRTKDFNETAQYIMFYDMGASGTTATIVSLQNVKTKEKGYIETHPQINVIGVGYDRTLGGLDMQIRFRDFLGKKFNEMKKTKTDVFTNPRSMAKLFKEAGRVKNVLSANLDHYAQIEGLLDEIDFRVKVTREDFEGLNEDLFARVRGPIDQALKLSGLTMDVINQVVLVGAGTRVPKVQEILQEIVKTDLAKNLNTDEAAAMGAVYKAADLSTGFKVKKFITKDAILFPVQVLFERETDGATKQVKRTLFGVMNPYPQKKIITFNKHTDDFSFNVNYADLDHLNDAEVLNLGKLNLTEYQLEGVAEAMGKHVGDNIDNKGIKVHFAMDDSGILGLANVEFVQEQTVAAEAEEEGAFSKLGSTISKLFSGDDNEKKSEDEPLNVPEEKFENNTNSTTNDTQEADAKNATSKLPSKPKIVTIKEPIKSTETVKSLNKLTPTQIEASAEKIRHLTAIETEINRRAGALNNLESYVIDVQTKLTEKEYEQATVEGESAKIRQACSDVSDWLYEDGSDATAEVYEAKLAELEKLTRELYIRVFEHRERPEALDALKQMLNGSKNFLVTARNHTKDTNPEKDIFTDVELEALNTLIQDTESWRDKKLAEQNKLKRNEPIKLTVKALSDKMQALDREVKYLVNKIKIWRPKKVEKPVVEDVKVEDVKDDVKPADEAETRNKSESDDAGADAAEEAPETIDNLKDSEKPTETKEQSEDEHIEL